MSHPVLSVCIVCLICATHSPCGSHAAVKHESQHITNDFSNTDPYKLPLLENDQESLSRVKLKQGLLAADDTHGSVQNETPQFNVKDHSLFRRSSISDEKSNDSSKDISKENYLSKIFERYGDGNTMTMEGFEKFIEHLDLFQILSKLDSETNKEGVIGNLTVQKGKKDNTCIDKKQIFTGLNVTEKGAKINDTMLRDACPAILYTLMVGQCSEEPHLHSEENFREHSNNTVLVWVYSTIAVILTSACGVLAVVVIPIMQMKFYKPLLQFLIALAASTLSGDAFLHLLPHAMTKFHVHGPHDHHEEIFMEGGSMDPHQENTWKGFVAMTGLMFLFFMERIILIIGKWRKAKQKKPDGHSHMKILSNGLDDLNEGNPTQCVDRYNAFPYCYQDIINHQLHGCPHENDKTASSMLDDVDVTSDISFKKSRSPTAEIIDDGQNAVGGCANENNLSSCTEVNRMLPERTPKNDNITIILREHGNSHHGHSHSHGHVHSAPQNLSSVAWMVIMGDGLHNFTDGIAIGAAFSVSLAGGFSTTVAVFCHELPHELGDFAMLLKAGMSIRQALFYNLLSSVLSLFGNYVGILVGNTEYASSWVFAGAAGMFIYIALVDMLPELSSSHEDEDNFTQYLLHMGGMLSGFAIMALIAIYENELKSIFKEPM